MSSSTSSHSFPAVDPGYWSTIGSNFKLADFHYATSANCEALDKLVSTPLETVAGNGPRPLRPVILQSLKGNPAIEPLLKPRTSDSSAWLVQPLGRTDDAVYCKANTDICNSIATGFWQLSCVLIVHRCPVVKEIEWLLMMPMQASSASFPCFGLN